MYEKKKTEELGKDQKSRKMYEIYFSWYPFAGQQFN